MHGRVRTWLRRSGVAAAIVGALPIAIPAAQVAHAAATTTVAFYSMDEEPGTSVLVDSSGNGHHGYIGADVVRGVRYSGATAHRFPSVPTSSPPTYPEHLDRIPDASSLDPGTSDYAVTVRFRTTENFGNIIQKGQNASIGGYWKFEAPQGIVTCLFKGGSGAQRAVSSPTALNDGQWHTVRCERTSTALRMSVDGVFTGQLAGTIGSIANDREITIAGKGECDQVEVTCDYFVGDVDYVRIEKGSAGAANVAPTASFTPSCVGLVCSFTSTSTDPDGAIQTFAWTFGDGTTGQYAKVSKTFAAAGTYTVTLTVTDDRGATRSVAQDVTVAPAPEVISFVGQSSASANAVTHTATIPAATQAGDALLMFFADNNDATIGTPTGVTGWMPLDSISGGYATTRVWRRVAKAGDAGDPVSIPLSKQAKGNLIIAAYRGTHQADPVAAHARVADLTTGTTRTTPLVDVAIPQSWGVSYWMHGDSSSTSLTPPGSVVQRAAGSQSGGGRVTTLLADSGASLPNGTYGGLTVTTATASNTSSAWTIILRPTTGPVENVAPTASFTSSCNGLQCSFNSTASADSDGVVMSRSWNFGDGATSTATNPSRTFAAGGTYTVTLTVTDDDGATGTSTATVTVPYAPPVNVISFVGSAAHHTTSTSFTVTVPATVQQGDALILFMGANTTQSASAPSGVGWQSLGVVTAGSQRSRAWRKVAGPADAGTNVTVTLGGSSKASLLLSAYRGTDPTNPVSAATSASLTTNSASRPSPMAPVAGSQSWGVSFWAHMDSNTTTLTPPSGVTARAGGTQTSSNRVTTLVADSNGLIPSGTYGGLVAKAVAFSTAATAFTVILAPQTAPPANVAPNAEITSAACTALDCTFTATSSNDPDGTIQSYAWDFGDGTGDAGASPAVHTYAADGTYTVTLTVTDDDGATDVATTTVNVSASAPTEVITYVGGTIANANATTHSVTLPAGVQPGDGLLLMFSFNTTAAITDPSGWATLDTILPGGTTSRVWRKVATAADVGGSTVTVPVSAISKGALVVLAYRGTSTVDPVASFARSSLTNSSASRTTPTAPVSGSQSWAVSYWAHKDSTTNALTPPPGVAVRAAGTQTSGGRMTVLAADSGGVVPAGTYGGLTATAAAASTAAATWTIVLAPTS